MAASTTTTTTTTAAAAADAEMMELAIAQAHLSDPIQEAYCVGAVLALVDRATGGSPTVLTTGYSRELPGNTHAEECCLIKLTAEQRAVLDGLGGNAAAAADKEAVMYTTMEPCGLRLSGKLPCADRILDAKFISRVVVAIREPANFVEKCTGAQSLAAAGVKVDFLPEFAARAKEPFKHLQVVDAKED
ncbi:hypothetical protein DFJ73DRAFT_853656 [Zopfochytrium polystomum]|nr:hypothetical protein DFJ73DRAFT_853652 [Zopfochytrium polystomum]KAI9333766.1 hypothetical protein DFJ73DRAFT_853656 [Zopfochytrium polystomum]